MVISSYFQIPTIRIIDWRSLIWKGVLEEVCGGATLFKNITVSSMRDRDDWYTKCALLRLMSNERGFLFSFFPMYEYFVLFLQNVIPHNFATMYPLSIRGLNYTCARKISRIQIGQINLAFSSDLCYNSYQNINISTNKLIVTGIILGPRACRITDDDSGCE